MHSHPAIWGCCEPCCWVALARSSAEQSRGVRGVRTRRCICGEWLVSEHQRASVRRHKKNHVTFRKIFIPKDLSFVDTAYSSQNLEPLRLTGKILISKNLAFSAECRAHASQRGL